MATIHLCSRSRERLRLRLADPICELATPPGENQEAVPLCMVATVGWPWVESYQRNAQCLTGVGRAPVQPGLFRFTTADQPGKRNARVLPSPAGTTLCEKGCKEAMRKRAGPGPNQVSILTVAGGASLLSAPTLCCYLG